MSKRRFRSCPTQPADYPTLAEFDSGRRAFLARLGTAVGAASLGALLSACGGRRVGDGEPDDQPRHFGDGVARQPDAGQDRYPVHISDGLPRMPDSRQDRYPQTDTAPPTAIKDSGGVAPMPDALIDPPAEGGVKKDW